MRCWKKDQAKEAPFCFLRLCLVYPFLKKLFADSGCQGRIPQRTDENPASPQSAACSENFAFHADVSGQTIRRARGTRAGYRGAGR
jgi:hypothetical protein